MMAHTYIVGKSLVCRTERGFGMRSRFFFASPYTCARSSLHTTLYKHTHTHTHTQVCTPCKTQVYIIITLAIVCVCVCTGVATAHS